MTQDVAQARTRRPADAGPPLPLVAAVSTALLLAGIIVPAVLAGQPYPSPYEDAGGLRAYVASHPDALRLGSLFLFASSIPLAVFTAAVVARLHALGVRAAGPTIGLVGGVLAAAALGLSAAAQWVLSRLPADTPVSVMGAFRDLTFISGGPWHVVALGLLLAGIAVPAAFFRLLPRPVWIIGVALAVVCELATLAYAVTAASYLLPIGRFGGLAWLILAGALLPRVRPSRAGASDRSSRGTEAS